MRLPLHCIAWQCGYKVFLAKIALLAIYENADSIPGDLEARCCEKPGFFFRPTLTLPAQIATLPPPF